MHFSVSAVYRFCDEPNELYMEMDLAHMDMTVFLKNTHTMPHEDIQVHRDYFLPLVLLYANSPSYRLLPPSPTNPP
jgi:hypothetical protein